MALWNYVKKETYEKVVRELQEKLEEKTFRLSLLLELSRTINSAIDIEEILKIVLRAADVVTGAEGVSIALAKEDRLTLVAAHGFSLSEAKEEFSLNFKGSPMWHSYLTGEIYQGEEFNFGITSVEAVFPLTAPQKVLGVLNIHKGNPLSEETVRFLETLCSQAALALQNAGSLKRAKNEAKTFEQKATTDALTSLYNRLFMQERLPAEIERAKRNGIPLSLIMFDVDHFKKFNDTYGHPFGDVVLKEVARLLKVNIRPYDHAIRYGGEEFMVILPETTSEIGIRLAERIRKAVEKYLFVDPEKPDITTKVTISLGVAQWEQKLDMNELIERADKALYVSKEGGRNRTTVC